MKQLVSPNLTVQGKAGWCLWVAQEVWGVPHLYAKAIDAWNASSVSNHTDPLPDVAVPVYWTFFDRTDGVEYGHIATYVPNRGIYSSPFNSSFGSEWYPTIQALTERVNQIAGANCRYLGWSETLSGVQLVIEEEDMTIPDADNYYWRYGQKLARQVRGRELSRDEFRAALVGKTDLNAVEILSDDSEADTMLHAQDVGVIAVQDNWEGQIESLTKQLNDTKVALQNAENKPPVEVVKEVEKIITKSVYINDPILAKNTQDTLTIVKSIKGMLINFIGVVKNFIKKG